MSDHTDDMFAEIAEDALRDARDVECSTEDFIEGLQLILEMFGDELNAARATP